jgi:translation initiation factor RLI1
VFAFFNLVCFYVIVINCNQSKNCRLPVPRPGQVLGLVGINGIGKSTALKVLSGKRKPNLGRFTVRSTKKLVELLIVDKHV